MTTLDEMDAAQETQVTPRSESSGRVLVVPTKLRPPLLRRDLIERRELVERLRGGRDRRLTLVCAAAGYGKTTLLAQWEAADKGQTPFAWVSLDERDSDPVQLWIHIITALNEASERVGESSLPALRSGPAAIPETVLPLLVEELSGSRRLVLVLEDWHAVRNPVCDATVGMFVERAPEGVQVVISSRSDPGLPIARLRGHGELAEVRAADLRLSSSEAASLSRMAGLLLEPPELEHLVLRTEGWFAGISLVLLVVKQQKDPGRFVVDFAGDTRHVLDYLARDVLDTVAPAMRDFLVHTSVLERLSAPLCDAVLERSDSAAMLAAIERANLFLMSDESGTEYRYHQLFSAMLRRELEATADVISGLYARASLWHEANGDSEEAVEYAILSSDITRASALVLRTAPQLVSAGRLVTIIRWLNSLSSQAALEDHRLALIRAWVAGLRGAGLPKSSAGSRSPRSDQERGPLEIGIASIRSAVSMMRSALLTRGIEVAVREAKMGLELKTVTSPWRLALLIPLGQAQYLAGRPQEARSSLEEAFEDPLAMAGDAPTVALGLSYLALVELADGNVGASDASPGKPSPSCRSTISPRWPLPIRTWLSEAHCCTEPDLHAAVDHLERAVELATPAGTTYWRTHALLRLAAARHRLGDDDAARETLALARGELDELPDFGT